MNDTQRWNNLSAEEREQIASNRSRASYNNPFSGKNRSQRQRLNTGFNSMATRRQKLGSR